MKTPWMGTGEIHEEAQTLGLGENGHNRLPLRILEVHRSQRSQRDQMSGLVSIGLVPTMFFQNRFEEQG